MMQVGLQCCEIEEIADGSHGVVNPTVTTTGGQVNAEYNTL